MLDQQDFRVQVPKDVPLEIHAIGFNYLVMLMELSNLDPRFFAVQLLVALRFSEKFLGFDRQSLIFVGPMF